MTKQRSIQATVCRVAIGVVPLVGAAVGLLFIDALPLSAARPPVGLKTLEEFHLWKGENKGRGTFVNAGVIYTVRSGPPGSYTASGPAAYLFDEAGQFVDWTSDMGDLRTAAKGFDLSSSVVWLD